MRSRSPAPSNYSTQDKGREGKGSEGVLSLERASVEEA